MKFKLEDEDRSVSPRLSPGRVEDHEDLLRLVYEPEHIHAGQLVPAAIPSKDLQCRGYSTDRDRYKCERIIRKRAKAQMEKAPGNRKNNLVVKFRCEDIRAIALEEDSRDLIVVDYIIEGELPLNIAHASIYSVCRASKSKIKHLKNEMLKHMQNIHTLDEIFGRGEASFATPSDSNLQH